MDTYSTEIKEMADFLENNGEISITDGADECFIQAIDDKEGYAFVSSTNEEFETSKDAIKWAMEKINGIENLETWE